MRIVIIARTLVSSLLALALLLASAPASAGEAGAEVSGAALLSRCRASKDGAEKCGAFIEGVLAGMRAQRMFFGFQFEKAQVQVPQEFAYLLSSEPYCVPATAPPKELADHVTTFIEASDQAKEEPAAFGIMFALRESYPCAGSKPADPEPAQEPERDPHIPYRLPEGP